MINKKNESNYETGQIDETRLTNNKDRFLLFPRQVICRFASLCFPNTGRLKVRDKFCRGLSTLHLQTSLGY